jgi:hypothetical protein
VLLFCRDTLDPAGMISDDILVLNLADGNNLLVDVMHLEILIQTQMNLDLFDCVNPLIKYVLGFIHLSKTSLTDDADFFKESLVPILLQVLAELVVVSLLFVPEDYGLMDVFASRLVSLNSYKVHQRLCIEVNFDPAALLFRGIVLGYHSKAGPLVAQL